VAANISTVRALVNTAKMSENTAQNPVMIPRPGHNVGDKIQHEDRGGKNYGGEGDFKFPCRG